MPRIDPRTARLAWRLNPHLATLLHVCRTLESAQNELRWLQEHILLQQKVLRHDEKKPPVKLRDLVKRRARREPIQYILGSEFFGGLEIKCTSGVLIPRQETAASITHLVDRLDFAPSRQPADAEQGLRVLDLCTGSGCIPLLFHHEFYRKRGAQAAQLDMLGVDVSPAAVALALENQGLQLQKHTVQLSLHSPQASSLARLRFIQADVLMDKARVPQNVPTFEDVLAQLPEHDCQFDILISNPPYISNHHFRTVTEPSVRIFEPRFALVPLPSPDETAADGDRFYPSLWETADRINAKVVLLEVGDHDQALRVARLGAERGQWGVLEIWRDEPSGTAQERESVSFDGSLCSVVGSGRSRSVFAARGDGIAWTKQHF